MNAFHPLRFKPTFREYIWGGRRLGDVLNKPIGAGEHYAESWEIVDHGEDQSIVAYGPYADWSLRQFVLKHPRELFGQHPDFERFPLLFKFLDASRKLSVQVHPNDEQGKQLEPPDLGKTEAWVIIDADADSEVYVGLKPGFDRQGLAEEVAQGNTEHCLHSFQPQNGDCLFISAGLVHALGSGLLVAEIQQSTESLGRCTSNKHSTRSITTSAPPNHRFLTRLLTPIALDSWPATNSSWIDGRVRKPCRQVEMTDSTLLPCLRAVSSSLTIRLISHYAWDKQC